MQKWIAILFFLLLGSSTILQGVYLPVAVVEQLADSDKSKDAQPEKKESKEFLAGCTKRLLTTSSAIHHFCDHLFYWLPQPVLNNPTPPPDVIC